MPWDGHTKPQPAAGSCPTASVPKHCASAAAAHPRAAWAPAAAASMHRRRPRWGAHPRTRLPSSPAPHASAYDGSRASAQGVCGERAAMPSRVGTAAHPAAAAAAEHRLRSRCYTPQLTFCCPAQIPAGQPGAAPRWLLHTCGPRSLHRTSNSGTWVSRPTKHRRQGATKG